MSDKIVFHNVFVPGMQVANNRIPLPLANGNFWRADLGGLSLGVATGGVVYSSSDGVNYVQHFTLEPTGYEDLYQADVLGPSVKKIGSSYVISNTKKYSELPTLHWEDTLEKRSATDGALQEELVFTDNYYQFPQENERMIRYHSSKDSDYVFSLSGDYLFQLDGVVIEDDSPAVPLVSRTWPSYTANFLRTSDHWGAYGSSINANYYTTRIATTLHTSQVFYQYLTRVESPDTYYKQNVISIGPIYSAWGDMKTNDLTDYGYSTGTWESPNQIEFVYDVMYQITATRSNFYSLEGPTRVVFKHDGYSTGYDRCDTSWVYVTKTVPGMVSCNIRVSPTLPDMWGVKLTKMGNNHFEDKRRVAAVLNPAFFLEDLNFVPDRPGGNAFVVIYPESIKLRFQTQDYRGFPLMKVSKVNSDLSTVELHTPTVTHSATPATPGTHNFVENGIVCRKTIVDYSEGDVEATWPELVDADTGEIVFLKYAGPHKMVLNLHDYGQVSFLGETTYTNGFNPHYEVPNLFVVKEGYEEALLTLPEFMKNATRSSPTSLLDTHTSFSMSRFVLDELNTGYIFATGSWEREIVIMSVSGDLKLEAHQGVCKINGALYAIHSSEDGINFKEIRGGAVVNEINVPHACAASVYADVTRVVLISPTEIVYPTTNTMINLETWESTPYLEPWWEDPSQAIPDTFRGLAVGSGKQGLHYYVERLGATNGTFFQTPGGEVKPHVCEGTHLNLSATMYFYDGAFITDAYQPYFSTTFEIESEGE